MKFQKVMECEQKRIDKFSKFQIAHKYKKVGLIVFAISFVSILIVGFTAEGAAFEDLAKRLLKFGILLGLLLISVSKEKIEDERIINLRMQSYAFAFIWAVFVSLVFPYFSYAVDALFSATKGIQDVGDFFVLWMLLAVQVAFFHVLKKNS